MPTSQPVTPLGSPHRASARISLFTAQWGDLSLEEVAQLAHSLGYDGLELACTPQHLDIARTAHDRHYLDEVRAVLDRYELRCWAISNHMTSKVFGEKPLTDELRGNLDPQIVGDGDMHGIRTRARDALQQTAEVAVALGASTIVGFVGSTIWSNVMSAWPIPTAQFDAAFEYFAAEWRPILDMFADYGLRFAQELHPGGLSFDWYTSRASFDAVDWHPAYGLNWDPSHLMWQGLDPVTLITDFGNRIYHVHCKDTLLGARDGRVSILGSYHGWTNPARPWTFVTAGHGDVPWERAFRALKHAGYDGTYSVEWEDSSMDRIVGANDAVGFVRRSLWEPPEPPFDAPLPEWTKPAPSRKPA